jgi:hypothetical protein
MKAQTTNSRGGESGNILVVTILILFAVSALGATLAMVSSMDLKIAGNQRTTTQSLFVAEAGLNEAIHRLSLPNPTNVAVAGWSGNVAIGDTPPYDPNWTAMIYLTSPGAAPAVNGAVTTGTLQDPTQPYLEYSAPGGTDGVLTIRHKWIDRDGDNVRDANEVVRYDAIQIPPENFTSGYPVEIITVTGSTADGERMIQAEVTKRTINARTLGALYIDKAVRLVGTCNFCGYNHSISTPVGARSDNKKNPCDVWHLTTGHLPGVVTTGDEVKVSGSSEVGGNPQPIDDSPTNPFYTLPEVLGLTQSEVNDILANADNTSLAADPLNGITYINGDAKLGSNVVGEGLIYITGNLSGNGNLEYKGLIYVEGDVKLTGGGWILGSVIVRGTTDWSFSAGGAAVLYSEEAIRNALSSAMPCIVLSWREL